MNTPPECHPVLLGSRFGWCERGPGAWVRQPMRGEYDPSDKVAAAPMDPADGWMSFEQLVPRSRDGARAPLPLAIALRLWRAWVAVLSRRDERLYVDLDPTRCFVRWDPDHASAVDDLWTLPDAIREPWDITGEAVLDIERADLAVLPGSLPGDFSPTLFTAPEAESGVVGAQASTWCAGIVGLQLLTGHVARWHADVPHVLAALRIWRPGLPARVQLVLDHCLAADPAQRAESLAYVAGRLDDALDFELQGRRSVPYRPPADVVCYRDRQLGKGKRGRLARGVGLISSWQDDELAYDVVAEGELVSLAVFDGVSTVDPELVPVVGEGEDALRTGGDAAHFALRVHESCLDRIARLLSPAPCGVPYLGAQLADAAEESISVQSQELSKAVEAQYGAAIHGEATQDTPTTTATVALVRGDLAGVSWSGDSSAYLVTPDGVSRLTYPMNAATMKMFVEENGSLPASLGSRGKSLVSVLGKVIRKGGELKAVPPELGRTIVRCRRRDLLVLCTDGIDEFLGEDRESGFRFLCDQARLRMRNLDPVAAAEDLFEDLWARAIAQQSGDNMTLMVLPILGEPRGVAFEGPPVDPEPTAVEPVSDRDVAPVPSDAPDDALQDSDDLGLDTLPDETPSEHDNANPDPGVDHG